MTLIVFPSDVMNGLTGDRILVTSAEFAAGHPSPASDFAVTPDEALITNNAGSMGAVMDCFVFADGFESGDTNSWAASIP